MNRIVHWNIRGYVGNFEDLKILIRNSGSPACVCLQETLLGDKKAYPPSRYYIYQRNQNNPNGNVLPRGIALLINKKIPHTILNLNRPLEAQAVS